MDLPPMNSVDQVVGGPGGPRRPRLLKVRYLIGGSVIVLACVAGFVALLLPLASTDVPGDATSGAFLSWVPKAGGMHATPGTGLIISLCVAAGCALLALLARTPTVLLAEALPGIVILQAMITRVAD